MNDKLFRRNSLFLKDLRNLKTYYSLGVEIIDVLLKAGADRGLRDLDGKTAVQAASEAGRSDCVSALDIEMGDAKVGSVVNLFEWRWRGFGWRWRGSNIRGSWSWIFSSLRQAQCARLETQIDTHYGTVD